MTLSPNTPLSAENVGLLKAGDWLKVTNACSFLKAEGYPNGSLVTVATVVGEYVGIAEIPYPQSTYAHRFTYIGPDLGDGWIGWSGGDCPVDYRQDVEVKFRGGHVVKTAAGVQDWTWLIYKNDDDDIIAFRPALSPPAEGVDWESPPADPPTPEMQALMQRYQANQSAVGVDWTVVGLKLVEAIDPADMDAIGLWINEGEQPSLVPSGRIKAVWQAIRAALSAAQPQSDGE